ITATKVEVTGRNKDDLSGYKNDHKHYNKSEGGFNQKMDQEDLKTYTVAFVIRGKILGQTQAFPTRDSSDAGPSVSNQRKRTRQSSKIIRASNETDTSKRDCRPEGSTKGIAVRRQTRRLPRLGVIHAEGSSSGHGRGPSLVYDDLGDCAHQCRRCEAAIWYGERLNVHFAKGLTTIYAVKEVKYTSPSL
nr:hypothetical protein [Tanacetum cinerariifolium]